MSDSIWCDRSVHIPVTMLIPVFKVPVHQSTPPREGDTARRHGENGATPFFICTPALSGIFFSFCVFRFLHRFCGSSRPGLVFFCCLEPVWASQSRIWFETKMFGCESARVPMDSWGLRTGSLNIYGGHAPEHPHTERHTRKQPDIDKVSQATLKTNQY